MPRKKEKLTAGQKASKTILSRTLFLMVVCGVLMFIPIIRQLYVLQIVDHDYYEGLAVENQTKQTSVSASRGTIYDSNMEIIAISAGVYNVFIDPNEIHKKEENIDLIAEGLSNILGTDPNDIREMAAKTNLRYQVVKRKIEQDLTDQVREFITDNELSGIYLEPDTKRYYPSASLAAQVIGFVGMDNTGLDGIEAVYDSYLQGTAGRIITAKSNDGTEMLYTFEKYYDATNGDNMVLTIDSTVQYFLEKNLQAAIEQYDVRNGAFGVVMNVNTGEILAMATLSSYDPNNYADIYDEDVKLELATLSDDEYESALVAARLKQWRNRVVSDGYEPGSTFKTITLASALEEGAVTLDSQFYCGGSTTIKGRVTPLNCWKDGGHGAIDTAGALQGSCNIAFADIGIRLGAKKLYEYVKAFGLMEETGIDLPGESSGIFFGLDILDDPNSYASLTSAAFGQTFKVTPLQLVRAISAVVNGGYLMKPYVVSEIIDDNGNVLEKTEPTVIRQVISEGTSKIMCQLLESVVTVGTAKNAYIAGYRIGGKTGTSEKIDVFNEDGTMVDDKIVSFVAVAPADDPQYICLVALDTPSTSTGLYISGGQMAAPTAREVMSDILPYLGVEPQYTAEELGSVDATVPYLTGMTIEEAAAVLSEKGFAYRVAGDGNTVTDQLPLVGATVPQSAEIILYAGEARPDTKVAVPDVMGMSAENANYAITNAGLYMKAVGAVNSYSSTIVVTKQSIAAGEEVDPGTVIEVEFTDLSARDH